MTFIEPGGRQSLLVSTFLPAPLHALPAFLGFKFLNCVTSWLRRALNSLMPRHAKG